MPESENAYNNVDISVDMMPDATVVAHTDSGIIIDVNEATEDLFNSTADNLIGKNQWELHPKGDKELYQEAFKRGTDGERVDRLKNGEPVYIKTADNQLVPVEINVNVVRSAGEQYIIGAFRDISEQIERENELRGTTSRLNTLLDTLPVPVSIVDIDGTVTLWNREATRVLGYEEEEVIGEEYSYFTDDKEFINLLSRCLEGESISGHRTIIRAKNGRRVPIELYANPVYEDGEITSILGVSVDLSNREQRERQLNVLQRVLRHNLRNEVSIIKGWIGQIKENGCSENSIARIEQSSEDLIELTNQVKDIRNVLDKDENQTTPMELETFESKIQTDTIEVDYIDDSNDLFIPARGVKLISKIIDECSKNTDSNNISVSINNDENFVTVIIQSDDQLLPDSEMSYLSDGIETPLDHADDLSIAYVYILAKSVGGEIRAISNTCISVEIPKLDSSN